MRRRRALGLLLLRTPLNERSLQGPLVWAFRVLGLDVFGRGVDVAAVQRACRNILKALHPDVANRRGMLPSHEVFRLGDAAERVKAAKQRCEEFVSGAGPPLAVQRLHLAEVKNATLGSREFLVRWHAPPTDPARPVKRYVVSAVDPKFGMREVMIASIEPNFDVEQGRYLEEATWCEYLFSETQLDKMPQLFAQPFCSLSVVAANTVGSSSKTSLMVPISTTSGGARRQERLGINSFSGAEKPGRGSRGTR